ncbi:nitroreductase family protein [Microaceticoccus formicicus]|uniref:nitroreductase family protein n=1 Tax=Microaceticoccus formicicus TaxID=3118105 RepID=UPI003CD051E0|nr:nitroreductase family protein [Peptoniphilaceae bacterium AMB_02]
MKDLIDIIKTRRTIRNYKTEKVDRDILEKLMEAAKHAPTGMNNQNRRFTIIENAEIIKKFEREIESALNREDYSLFNTPVFLIISVPRDSENGLADTAVAIQNLYLAATYYGLGCCWINQLKHCYDTREIRELLTLVNIPEDEVVYGAMTIGYPKDLPESKARIEKHYYID